MKSSLSSLLFGFIFGIPYLFHPMHDVDEGSHAAVAAELMDGGLPYLDAVNNKPPGIFCIYQATLERDRADITWLFVPEAWPMLETDLNIDPPELIIDTSPGNYHDYGKYPMGD